MNSETAARDCSFQTPNLLYPCGFKPMKNFRFLLCLTAILCTPLAFAQDKPADADPAKPPVEKPAETPPELPAAPVQPGQPTPKPAFTEPLPLIPDALEPVDRPRSLGSQKNKASHARAKAEGTLPERIHLRELKTRALDDGTIQQQWDFAQQSRTDAGKREGMKKYYSMLYDRMAHLDPKLKPALDKRKDTALHRIEQRHIQASELIEDRDGEMPLEAGMLRATDSTD